ncbi:MAG: serine hydrolase domain-containing protein [Saprospiraceae bacterium]
MRTILPIFVFCSTFLLAISLNAQDVVVTSPEEVGLSKERLMRLHHFLEKEISTKEIAGSVALVARKGKVVHYEAQGKPSLQGEMEIKKDAIFYIQSMTKPIITVAFMMLYEEGHFMINDPIEKYLPQFKDRVVWDPDKGADSISAAKTPITIAHLLSHTAGLTHGLGRTDLDRKYGMALYRQKHENIESRVNSMKDLPLIGHPGEQWYYSAAPDVLALLIEQFSGTPIDQFLQERIFDPLKMKDTGYNLTETQAKRAAALHYKTKEGLVTAPTSTKTSGNTVFGGTHGLFSTARDYYQFSQMLLNGGKANGVQFLSPKTLELMTQNQVGDLYPAPGEGFGFGFGVVDDLATYDLLGSEGQFYWSGAYSTYFFIDPKEEMVVILMTQLAPSSRMLAKKLRLLVYQAIVD